MCCQGKLLEISNAAEKYFFSHPFDLVRFAGDDDGNYTHVLSFYMLPDNAYTEAESFDSFVHAFVDSGYLNLLGRILGRSIKGTDDIFPHEYVREFLGQHRINGRIHIGGHAFYENQQDTLCICSQGRTDSSCQAGPVSQNQIR